MLQTAVQCMDHSMSNLPNVAHSPFCISILPTGPSSCTDLLPFDLIRQQSLILPRIVDKGSHNAAFWFVFFPVGTPTFLGAAGSHVAATTEGKFNVSSLQSLEHRVALACHSDGKSQSHWPLSFRCIALPAPPNPLAA